MLINDFYMNIYKKCKQLLVVGDKIVKSFDDEIELVTRDDHYVSVHVQISEALFDGNRLRQEIFLINSTFIVECDENKLNISKLFSPKLKTANKRKVRMDGHPHL